ncbi:unnamed protein product [Rhizoctonia solani]|uniref:Uncharacterized protein n=1 Tax=Rhizoctonia solani TaxID=456999 RepID=A0A8H3HH37_9AGAM|nr:unnamed protein product [Rhizoctonia solani]
MDLNAGGGVKIERVHMWKANARRNDRPIATLQWGVFGGFQLEMIQGGQRTSQEQTPPKVRWEGIDYLYAVHLEKDRVVATFDPREQTIELKSWVELESDVDIVNELALGDYMPVTFVEPGLKNGLRRLPPPDSTKAGETTARKVAGKHVAAFHN